MEKRARDADRDLAVEFIEAAWIDGQLSHEEYDERVDRVLRSRTVAEVEQEVRDLQGPGGAVWRPAVPPSGSKVVRPTPRPVPAPRPTPPPPVDYPQPDGVTALVRLGVALGGVALLAVVALGLSSGDEQWAQPVPDEGLDVAELTEAVESRFGTTQVESVRVRDDGRVRVVVPSEQASAGAYESVWNPDTRRWSRSDETTARGPFLDLDELRGAALEDVNAAAWQVTDDVERVVTWLESSTVAGSPTCLRTVSYTSDGEEHYLYFDCDGWRVE